MSPICARRAASRAARSRIFAASRRAGSERVEGAADPLARVLATAHEREGERPVGDAVRDRQLGDERRRARGWPGDERPLPAVCAMIVAIAVNVSALPASMRARTRRRARAARSRREAPRRASRARCPRPAARASRGRRRARSRAPPARPSGARRDGGLRAAPGPPPSARARAPPSPGARGRGDRSGSHPRARAGSRRRRRDLATGSARSVPGRGAAAQRVQQRVAATSAPERRGVDGAGTAHASENRAKRRVVIVLDKVTKRFGPKILFENVSMQFDPGKRYGLTGANGAGKTTLLKMLEGNEDTDTGAITIPGNLRLGVLRQNHFEYEQERILDTVIMGKKALWAAMAEKERLLAGEVTDEVGVRLGELEGTIGEEDGYTAEGDAAELLVGLGIPADKHESKMNALAGGYKLRVLIAQVLYGKPDVLLLDEPTNHLDLESIRWLEQLPHRRLQGNARRRQPRPPLPQLGRDAHRRRRLPDDHGLHRQLPRLRRREVREQPARRLAGRGREEEGRRAPGVRAALRFARVEEQAGAVAREADRQAEGGDRGEGPEALEPRASRSSSSSSRSRAGATSCAWSTSRRRSRTTRARRSSSTRTPPST